MEKDVKYLRFNESMGLKCSLIDNFTGDNYIWSRMTLSRWLGALICGNLVALEVVYHNIDVPLSCFTLFMKIYTVIP